MTDVYVSYSWGVEEQTRLVEKLEITCQKRGIELKRDKNHIGYGDSIRAYMDHLAASGHIILVLSEAYFKSEYCMYELKEIYENRDFRKRVYPIVLEGTSFHRPIERIPYLRYWEAEKAKLQTEIETLKDPTYTINLRKSLDDYAEFRRLLDQLQAILADMNTLTEGIHVETDFEALLGRITGRQQKLQRIAVGVNSGSNRYSLKSNDQSTGNTSVGGNIMGSDHITVEKTSQLEEQISKWQKKLHHYEMALADAEGPRTEWFCKEEIKKIKQKLTQVNTEYAELLQSSASNYIITDGDAQPIVGELVEVVEKNENNQALSADIHANLLKIKEAVLAPETSAAAKLKVALPIVPLLASYELELDTERFITSVWTSIRRLLSRLSKAPNPP